MATNILLLAVLKPGSGNLSTADRIRGYFEDCSRYKCWMRDSNSFKSLQEFHGHLLEKDVHVIIAIHALHSGSLLTGDKFLDGSNGCVWNTSTQKFINGSLVAAAKRWDELSKHKQPIANDHWSQTLHQDKLLRPSVVCIRETDDDSETLDYGCHGNSDSTQRAAATRFMKLFRKRAASVDCSRTMIEKQQDSSASHRSVACRIGGRKRSWSLSHLDARDVDRSDGGKVAREAPASTGGTKTTGHRHIPYVLICAGTDLNEFSKEITSLRLMTRAILGAKFVVSFSEPLLRKVKALWPVLSKSQLKEIPQAVMTFPSDLSIDSVRHHFGLCEDAVFFVMVSGIRPVKDPLYLVNAFSDWHLKKRKTVYLLIIGPLMHAEYGKTFLEVVNRAPGVVYLGAQSLADTHALIQASFALINSSLSEGMSTAILEAMDLGVPVIARNIPGNRAIIDHTQTGLLYDSATDFLESAEQLLSVSSLRTDIITCAKHKIRSRHHCDDERDVYFSLVDDLAKFNQS